MYGLIIENNNNIILNKILTIYNSKDPCCWNYSKKDYPPKYHSNVIQSELGLMTYSEEFCDNFFDSDGENISHVSKNNEFTYNMSISAVHIKKFIN